MTKKIVLFCAGGMSTSLLVNRMKEAASLANKDYDIAAYGLGKLEEQAKNADCILLGPQVRYALNNIQKDYPNIPISGIDMRVYGMMDGKGTLAIAQKLLGDE